MSEVSALWCGHCGEGTVKGQCRVALSNAKGRPPAPVECEALAGREPVLTVTAGLASDSLVLALKDREVTIRSSLAQAVLPGKTMLMQSQTLGALDRAIEMVNRRIEANANGFVFEQPRRTGKTFGLYGLLQQLAEYPTPKDELELPPRLMRRTKLAQAVTQLVA